MTSDQKIERLMALVEKYRTSGGQAEHFANKGLLRAEISALAEDALNWSKLYHLVSAGRAKVVIGGCEMPNADDMCDTVSSI